MPTPSHVTPFDLPRAGILGLTHDEPLFVRCLAGRLWITQVADPADHVLGPGESRAFAANPRTVIQALEPARGALEGRATANAEAATKGSTEPLPTLRGQPLASACS